MCKIKLKNFGPIIKGYTDDEGWLDVKKVTVLTGNQGSGKSTLAKLISTFIWIEKALIRGDLNQNEVEANNKFKKEYCAYQNIHNFFRTNTEIEFIGTAYSFEYKISKFNIKKLNEEYHIPKVMYVPAERNFISAVSQPEKLKHLPNTLYTFLDEFIRSSEEIIDSVELPINNIKYRFDKTKRNFKLVGKDYEINLSEASSGLQSALPLYLVTKNLAESINKNSDLTKTRLSVEEMEKIKAQLFEILTDKTSESLQKSAIDLLSRLTKNECFINIVEEPEQNLFPISQHQILNSLLKFNNLNAGNKLIMTTHSPYLINYLTLAVKGNMVRTALTSQADIDTLNKIIPTDSTISASDLVIYQLDEKMGSINKLPNYQGLPTDENYLNESLNDSNEIFTQLQEIEKGWQ